MKYRVLTAVAALACMLLAGCATSIPAAPREERSPADPWEPMNRRIQAFNTNVDKVSFKPLAKGYEAIVPPTMRRGIGNFSRNLLSPLNIINNFLQGKFKRGFGETGRFLANSTWGILGFVDVGSDLGLEPAREDFGQTLAVWGIPDGPFVTVPFLGPRTLRGALMIPLNFYADLNWHIDDDATRRSLYLIRAIDVRQRLFAAEALMEDSYDRYLTVRESYLQNRRFLIFDGDVPEDEDFYDDFYEEFEEE